MIGIFQPDMISLSLYPGAVDEIRSINTLATGQANKNIVKERKKEYPAKIYINKAIAKANND